MLIQPSLNMAFNPAAWETDKLQNNCFSYALNAPQLRTINLGQQHRIASGDHWPGPYKPYSPDDTLNKHYMRALAASDGLIQIQEHACDPAKNHIVALFGGMAPPADLGIGDFHFMRLDGDHSWSHKRARGEAEIERLGHMTGGNTADQLLQIYRQGKCASHFIGFYKLPDEGIVLERS